MKTQLEVGMNNYGVNYYAHSISSLRGAKMGFKLLNFLHRSALPRRRIQSFPFI